MHKLRVGLQNLKNDVQLYHVSNQLKIQNLKTKSVSGDGDGDETKET